MARMNIFNQKLKNTHYVELPFEAIKAKLTGGASNTAEYNYYQG